MELFRRRMSALGQKQTSGSSAARNNRSFMQTANFRVAMREVQAHVKSHRWPKSYALQASVTERPIRAPACKQERALWRSDIYHLIISRWSTSHRLLAQTAE
jgi:hypothetical protein